MAIPEYYINNTGSLAKFLESTKTAGVPERVTFEFLKTLGFKSSNDRPIISVLKGIGFLDANGMPTEQYKAYRTDEGPRVLARALRNAYADIFLANTNAHTLSLDKLKGIIAGKTTKKDSIVELIARTFQVLAKAGDFSEPPEENHRIPDEPNGDLQQPRPLPPAVPSQVNPHFHYNIQIHLPTTTDVTVYNAVFKSLKENLLP